VLADQTCHQPLDAVLILEGQLFGLLLSFQRSYLLVQFFKFLAHFVSPWICKKKGEWFVPSHLLRPHGEGNLKGTLESQKKKNPPKRVFLLKSQAAGRRGVS